MIRSTVLLSALVLGLWQFPTLWYTRTDPKLGAYWLSERDTVPGWVRQDLPLSKSAESALVADRLFNAEFKSPDGAVVRAFSAKRYSESGSEIGLFVHTPDRCWTEAGWKLSPAQPEFHVVMVEGMELNFERRIFIIGGQQELVYFTGLVGGQTLPYRLDHSLSVGMKHALALAADKTGSTLRASDRRFWRRVWDAFLARRPLVGPKQFLRISTPCSGGDLAAADTLLENFLSHWLRAADYHAELAQWGGRKPKSPAANSP